MGAYRLTLLALACALLTGAAAADPAQAGGADCASVAASTRLQAYGYAHVVTLQNRCQRAVSCEVWTNVDPTPHYTLQAKPGASAEVVTRNGSPSHDVHAEKSCHVI